MRLHGAVLSGCTSAPLQHTAEGSSPVTRREPLDPNLTSTVVTPLSSKTRAAASTCCSVSVAMPAHNRQRICHQQMLSMMTDNGLSRPLSTTNIKGRTVCSESQSHRSTGPARSRWATTLTTAEAAPVRWLPPHRHSPESRWHHHRWLAAMNWLMFSLLDQRVQHCCSLGRRAPDTTQSYQGT